MEACARKTLSRGKILEAGRPSYRPLLHSNNEDEKQQKQEQVLRQLLLERGSEISHLVVEAAVVAAG